MQDLTGQTLDRYEILQFIAEGGMAAVYRGRQPRLKRDVAVKVMLPALAADPTFRERFEREAQAIANLRHPNILKVTDIVEVDGSPGLVMEYVAGPSLDKVLIERSLTAEQIDSVARGIIAGVAAAHRAGLIHRDIKPANVLLATEQGAVDWAAASVQANGAAGIAGVGTSVGVSVAENRIGFDSRGLARDAGVRAQIIESSVDADGSVTVDALAQQEIHAEVGAGSVAVGGSAIAGVASSGAGIETNNLIRQDVIAAIDGNATD